MRKVTIEAPDGAFPALPFAATAPNGFWAFPDFSGPVAEFVRIQKSASARRKSRDFRYDTQRAAMSLSREKSELRTRQLMNSTVSRG